MAGPRDPSKAAGKISGSPGGSNALNENVIAHKIPAALLATTRRPPRVSTVSETPQSTSPNGRSSPAWSPFARVSVVLILAGLLAVALLGRSRRPEVVTGMPEDPGVTAALAVMAGSVLVWSGDLRLESSWTTDEHGPRPGLPLGLRPGDSGRITEAERWLLEAQQRRPRDARVDGLLGYLEVVRHRYERGEERYRAAVEKSPGYGEARLGLGVTLALRARTEGDTRRARGLVLEAIAQLAAVTEQDPFFLPALYDRILLLQQVGRGEEARRLANRYIELEPAGAWSGSLQRMLFEGG